MAIKLYRKGTTHNVDGIECEVRLFARNPLSFVGIDGWCAKPEDINGVVSDLDDWEGYTSEQIREKAKDSGIEGWENKRINTLKEVLSGQSS